MGTYATLVMALLAVEPATAPVPLIPSAPSVTAPAGSEARRSTDRDRAPSARSEPDAPGLYDPWSEVPVQSVTPVTTPSPSDGVPRAPTRSSSVHPLLDPWESRSVRHPERSIEGDLRDPFGSARGPSDGALARMEQGPGARNSRMELRDPFRESRLPDPSAPVLDKVAPEPHQSAPVLPAGRASAPASSPKASVPARSAHPDLRDPFRPPPDPEGTTPAGTEPQRASLAS